MAYLNPWMALFALHPLQLWLIPRLQRRVNALSRERVLQERLRLSQFPGWRGPPSARVGGGTRVSQWGTGASAWSARLPRLARFCWIPTRGARLRRGTMLARLSLGDRRASENPAASARSGPLIFDAQRARVRHCRGHRSHRRRVSHDQGTDREESREVVNRGDVRDANRAMTTSPSVPAIFGSPRKQRTGTMSTTRLEVSARSGTSAACIRRGRPQARRER